MTAHYAPFIHLFITASTGDRPYRLLFIEEKLIPSEFVIYSRSLWWSHDLNSDLLDSKAPAHSLLSYSAFPNSFVTTEMSESESSIELFQLAVSYLPDNPGWASIGEPYLVRLVPFWKVGGVPMTWSGVVLLWGHAYLSGSCSSQTIFLFQESETWKCR